MVLITKSAKETQIIAKKLSKLVKEGDTIALSGNLGAGKTTFTQGFCKALGVNTEVTSPTFTLINMYQGSHINMNHIDLYRLDYIEDWYDIGIEDYIPPKNSITLVEWADKFPELLPEDYISIKITYEKDNSRNIDIQGIGQKYKKIEIK